MLAVFLPSLNFRGNRSPYLWWFYKFVSELGKEAAYVCGDEYFLDPALHLAKEREDASVNLAQRLKYEIPGMETLAGLARQDIPHGVWNSFEDRFPSNPSRVFEHFCLEEDNCLSEAIADSFDRIESQSGKLEAVITCVNCATLTALCRRRGTALIHFELGPLRAPNFLPTAYFDFSGVNGNTEARTRFEAARHSIDADEWCKVEALKSLFLRKELRGEVRPDVDLGLALQVEDDSNIICYSNGFSSLSMLNDAQVKLADERIGAPVLVRSHPGSLFSVRNALPRLVADQSETAVDFILRCKRIHTINSSVAVEALLLGREVVVFGESPLGFCIDPSTHVFYEPALAFFLLNYLVPWDIAFSTEYIRWRLELPSEDSIRKTHLKHCMQEKQIRYLESQIGKLEAQVGELERALAMENERSALLKSSFSWRLTRPLRTAHRMVRRIMDRSVQ